MLRIIISGGGTGGHIYPAIAIADELRRQFPDTVILFVGAEGRMEMEKVPAAGYPVVGLPVAGLQRRWSRQNFALPFKLLRSIRKALRVIKDFKPDAVVGVGGYASVPILRAAQWRKIPTLLQEQNAYAGMANRYLARRARRICVAYDGMERFFPKDKIRLTGNPIRFTSRRTASDERAAAAAFFGLSPDKKTVLVVGGSLGARTLNRTMTFALPVLACGEVQFVWQTGKPYIVHALEALRALKTAGRPPVIKAFDFIYRMDYAYAIADAVVSRAGAGAIAELCMAGKACIFVPSPNVAEDHQTGNAQALVAQDAALMIPDANAETALLPALLKLLQNDARLNALRQNAAALARPNAACEIVKEIQTIAAKYEV
ncbi:MAG: undecaprenyldiphospho-muramoylpentapeptide beta-N-acetylglucosaminyltransferase [Prevotellaceae bacterium]|jgi:UDP-N-acetylglucosamine--N-acetylmuramyl-(pentapeptide) pyrophosphoryl-undecaprenol N-acetylglucosamine transferase|nr:undecaprenyldiphospho-muramoylpentapeptide beta-N-acetylglucosaminyltransferase [Prevotellaceae bacterium]